MRIFKLGHLCAFTCLKITYHRGLAHGTVCLFALMAVSGCLRAPDKSDSAAPQDNSEVTAPLQKTETISPEACAAKIEATLESRREAVKALDYPICSAGPREWYDEVFRLIELEPEFPCMDAALRERYGVEEGSNLVSDDHALSPEMAPYSFGRVEIATCDMPYIAVARDTKRSVDSVMREEGFDSVSLVRHTLEPVERLRGELPQTFVVVKSLNGDYMNFDPPATSELEPLNETRFWAFCRLPNGTLMSHSINDMYEGPGGLELLKSRLALADEWDGDDACPDDWNESAEKLSP